MFIRQIVKKSSTLPIIRIGSLKFSTFPKIPGLVDHSVDYVVFPREREGLDYKLNWSLVDYLIPKGDAFGNIKIETLKRKIGVKSSECLFSSGLSDKVGNFVEAGISDDFGFDDFDEQKSTITKYLSTGVDLFVEDASLGSYRGSSIGVRIVSDDPVFAAISRNILIPVPKKHHSNAQPITVFIATGASDAVESMAFDESEDGELIGATVLLASSTKPLSLVKTLSHAVSVILGEKNECLVLAEAAATLKGNVSGLVIGCDAASLGALYQAQALYSGHGAIWGPKGLSATFGGSFLDFGSSSFKINEGLAVKVEKLLCVPTPAVNLAPIPSTVSFISKSSKAKVELSNKDAVDLLAETGVEAAVVEKFGQKLEGSATKCFRVSSVDEILKQL